MLLNFVARVGNGGVEKEEFKGLFTAKTLKFTEVNKISRLTVIRFAENHKL